MDVQIAERFAALESRIAYYEDQLVLLNTVVYEKQVQIDKLEKTIRELGTRYKDLVQGNDSSFRADQRPPHY